MYRDSLAGPIKLEKICDAKKSVLSIFRGHIQTVTIMTTCFIRENFQVGSILFKKKLIIIQLAMFYLLLRYET